MHRAAVRVGVPDLRPLRLRARPPAMPTGRSARGRRSMHGARGRDRRAADCGRGHRGDRQGRLRGMAAPPGRRDRRRDFAWDSRSASGRSRGASAGRAGSLLHRDASGAVDGYARYKATPKWDASARRPTSRSRSCTRSRADAYADLVRFLLRARPGRVPSSSRARARSERLRWLLTNARAAQQTDAGDGALGPAVRRAARPRGAHVRAEREPGPRGRRRRRLGRNPPPALDATPDGATCRPTDGRRTSRFRSRRSGARTSAARGCGTSSSPRARTSTVRARWPRPTRCCARPTSRGARRSSRRGSPHRALATVVDGPLMGSPAVRLPPHPRLVAERCRVPGLPAQLRRRGRRRSGGHRRPAGPPALDPGARGGRRLGQPLVRVADGGRRLRRRRLPGDRPALRDAGRRARPAPRRARARAAGARRHRAQPHVRRAPLVPRGPGRRAPARWRAPGISSATGAGRVGTSRPTTGARCSAAGRGRGCRARAIGPAEWYCHLFDPAPAGPGLVEPRGARGVRGDPRGSGSTSASTGSASTSPRAWSRPTACPTCPTMSARGSAA